MSSNTVPPPDQLEPFAGKVFMGVVAGVFTAVLFGLVGYFIIDDHTGDQGFALFFIVPFVTGFATALVTRGTALLLASVVLGAILCTSVLIFMGVEGFVCVIMSAPFVAFGLAAGAGLGLLVRYIIRHWRHERVARFLIIAVLPFFLMGADKVEDSHRGPRAETIANTLVTDASREKVWEQLKTFDRIDGKKGLLMTIGLPVPVSCSMEGEGVGATRTCYFEKGHIEERVTEWNPPSSMKFEITTFDVPGRPWLSFKDASYELTSDGGRTVLTRKTTIVSRLSPAWYWRPMEKIGVETEHEYLFEEVKRKIEAAK